MPENSRILLASLDTDIRPLLRRSLETAGYRTIIEAEDGAQAVHRLRSDRIDALVTDIPLGNLDGWRLSRLVRSGVFRCDPEIPIVVVTRSYSERIAEVTAKEYEINAFLPFERRHHLPGRLHNLLNSDGHALRKSSLLIIEDNPDTTRIVERVLQPRFEVEAAADGDAGLAAWRQRRHSLVLLDVMLPGLSGPEVLREILAERPDQSVVIMTADGTPERAGELVLEGAADFIAKPFRAEQLRRVCDIAVRREDYLRSNEQFAAQLTALNREKERALVTLESIADGVITTDTEGVVEYINPVAERLTGWRNNSARGQSIDVIFPLVNEFSRHKVPNPVFRALRERQLVTVPPHSLLVHQNGATIAIEDSVAPIKTSQGDIAGAVMVFHDVTEARKLTRQLTHQATHDSLTGLINRMEFERRLARLLDDARDNGTEHALCYLDLDQFKVVNDTCGHVAGDHLLQQLSTILPRHIRRGDTLARLGGDEFGVLLEYCDLERAKEIADALRQSVQDYRFSWDEKLFTIGVSIGVVPLSPENPNLEEALATADAACYLAKESGRNRIHVYSGEDGELVQRYGEMQWVSRINRALEEDRFALYVQDIITLAGDGGGEHFEFLVRMTDEDGSIVPPGVFLPTVERYDLASALDRWVLRRALEWLEAEPQRLHELHRCAINLSGKSLGDDHFHGFVHEVVSGSSVPPEKICFEITETAAITNLKKATEFIRRFREFGCYFALDDFGSGMSSFAYLKTLPVNYLKIDGAFVKDIAHDPIDHAMVRSINEIGHVMGLETIAEFVENDDILQRLRNLGVDYGQGFGIGRPRPID